MWNFAQNLPFAISYKIYPPQLSNIAQNLPSEISHKTYHSQFSNSPKLQQNYRKITLIDDLKGYPPPPQKNVHRKIPHLAQQHPQKYGTLPFFFLLSPPPRSAATAESDSESVRWCRILRKIYTHWLLSSRREGKGGGKNEWEAEEQSWYIARQGES